MDEFEKLEGDLKKLYEVYMEKFRNLTYLEQIVDAYDRQQQVKVEVRYSSSCSFPHQVISSLASL